MRYWRKLEDSFCYWIELYAEIYAPRKKSLSQNVLIRLSSKKTETEWTFCEKKWHGTVEVAFFPSKLSHLRLYRALCSIILHPKKFVLKLNFVDAVFFSKIAAGIVPRLKAENSNYSNIHIHMDTNPTLCQYINTFTICVFHIYTHIHFPRFSIRFFLCIVDVFFCGPFRWWNSNRYWMKMKKCAHIHEGTFFSRWYKKNVVETGLCQWKCENVRTVLHKMIS